MGRPVRRGPRYTHAMASCDGISNPPARRHTGCVRLRTTRWMKLMLRNAIAALLVLGATVALAVEPPVIPTAGDAYRMWERWAYQRIGERAYMRSTYDRSGGNDFADA